MDAQSVKKITVEQAVGVAVMVAVAALYAADCAGARKAREANNRRSEETHKALMEGHRKQMEMANLQLTIAKKEAGL